MSEQRRLIIKGGRRIEGELAVQGAKNSALPLLAAAVLCKGQTELYNCPRLSDCDAACRILSALGCSCKREGNVVCIDSSALRTSEISEKLMREMRSSIIFMGALIGRTGQCRLSFPGGCEIGSRPIDFHLDAFRKMGAKIHEEHGYIVCVASKLRGTRISFPVPSVGATENVMLAAVLADGVTEIHNAAREPEICDLAGFLARCGAKIEGAGTGTIHIEGVKRLV
ncbi:MAG: UDP-N-acetylglucosamine 1-carboxyvinyltransferase, partial [Selenomonadaceae bacterium]|nr:UDP-N-acetylglucosamine 1-carboxyvinyltransferase [Selenomonadaceae bacterium]